MHTYVLYTYVTRTHARTRTQKYIHTYTKIHAENMTCQHAYLALCVTEDNSLRDSESVVQVTQRVKLPFLSLHSCT